MYSKRSGDTIAVRLVAGEDVHESLIAACSEHGVRAGFVVSGIGRLVDAELGYFEKPGKYATRRFMGTFELLNLSGNVCEHDGALMGHLHAMLADLDYRVFGGHLVGAKVGLTLEVQVAVVQEPVRMYRRMEQEWGLPGLIVE